MIKKITYILYALVFTNKSISSLKISSNPLKLLKTRYISPIIKNITTVRSYKQFPEKSNYEARGPQTCIVFFTGASSFISPKIYNNFFNKLIKEEIDIYVPSFNYKNIGILVNTLSNEYEKVVIAGHSSGATVALKNIENKNINANKINTLILLDPVNTQLSNTSKPYNIETIASILFLYANKSYKITFDPFGLPFIPILKIPPEMLIREPSSTIQIVSAPQHGHADILNKEYGDFMHNTRIAVGNKNRTDESINNYHKWLAQEIKSYL